MSCKEDKWMAWTLQRIVAKTCVQAVAKCSGIIISHPFYVLSVRMMVQFVGQETIYSGLCASVKEIYINEGLGGFFSGIIPCLVGEVLSLLLYRGTCFLVSKYAIDSEVGRSKEVQVYRYVLFQFGSLFRTTSSIECELLEVRNSREEKETGQLLTWVKNRMKAKIWKSRDTREENEDGGKHPIRVGR
ncbi:mitochondrial carrier homolog 2-like isoform X1 [Pocillopora verrucosa]|uniref:mitochondrial carrier homolog 2-like isoform X1 n=1 Tax=Pocillopora verrucosa TaxID=203993 RepID=UPI00333EF812